MGPIAVCKSLCPLLMVRQRASSALAGPGAASNRRRDDEVRSRERYLRDLFAQLLLHIFAHLVHLKKIVIGSSADLICICMK